MVDKIANDVVVAMAYRMLVDGEEVESADAADPLYYLHGASNIVPGLEEALAGKTVGEKLTVNLEPSNAFGEYDDDEVQALAREDFDLPDDVKIGDEIELEDAEGDILEATIKDMTDEVITLDFNSPMAGKAVTFEVEILILREATEDEIEFGEPDEYRALFGDDHDHEE